MKFEDIIYYIGEAFEKAGYDFDKYHIEVSINPRLSTTLGRCKYVNRFPSKIELSAKFLAGATDKEIIDVIYHEAAHALVMIETREIHHHDACFKAMCKRIGTTNDKTQMKVEFMAEEPKMFKYHVICNKCGKIVGKYRRAGNVVKNCENYYCVECGGSLSVIQNY